MKEKRKIIHQYHDVPLSAEEEYYYWCGIAAELGDQDAIDLERVYCNYQPLESYSEKAFFFCKKAAELGHMEAMRCLSEMYFYGFGCLQDSTLAYKWGEKLRQASENR